MQVPIWIIRSLHHSAGSSPGSSISDPAACPCTFGAAAGDGSLVLESLLPTQEIQVEFWATGFSSAQSLAVAGIWGVNQRVESLSLSLSLLPFK